MILPWIGVDILNRPIIDLMDDKIRQLERYNEVTEKIIYEDLDTVGDLIAERQSIIIAMDGISLDMKQYISEQSIDRQDKINALLHFEDIGELNGEMLALQEKILRVKELREEIVRKDKIAFNRIKKERDEVRAKLENAGKGKQVSDYFSNTAVDLTKGSKLNISN